MRGLVALAGALVVAPVAAGLAPPQGVHAQCLMIGVIGLKWQPVEGAEAYTVYRGPDGVQWRRLGDARQPEYLDRGGLERGRTYFYAVTARQGDEESERAVVLAVNSSNLVASGDFETDELGATSALCFTYASNATGRLEIVPGARTGAEGKQILRVTGDASAPIIRLHTPFYWVVPGATVRVRAWCRAQGNGVARLGGQIRTAEGEKSQHMTVPYFQSGVIQEGQDGWNLFEGWSRPVPADAAVIQLWALGWRTRGPGWFDDLQVMDQRIIELDGYDLPAAIADIRVAMRKVEGADELRAAAETAIREAEDLSRRLEDPDLGVDAFLQASWDLLQAERRLEDARWDLKILSLRAAEGGEGQ